MTRRQVFRLVIIVRQPNFATSSVISVIYRYIIMSLNVPLELIFKYIMKPNIYEWKNYFKI